MILTRPCLKEVSPYFPGKPIREVQRELGLKEVLKLASNENPLGPSPKALKVLKAYAGETHLYPEGASPILRQALAKKLGTDPFHLVIGNGSDEIIRLLCEAVLSPEDEVVVSQYGFIRFKQQSLLMGAKVIEVPMTDFRHDLKTMASAASPRTKILFLASPNNPTGTYNTRSEVVELLKAVPVSCLVVLDEAYYHYAAQEMDYPESVPGLVRRHPNLVVLRTFSKVYGLAGVRVGFGVADPELVGWLDRIRMPFNVNSLGQEAALAALSDSAFVRRTVSLTLRARERLAADLRGLGFEVPDSSANFLFVRSKFPGRTLFKQLVKRGVIVRPLDEYGLAHHCRITVGTPAQNQILLRRLGEILKGRPDG